MQRSSTSLSDAIATSLAASGNTASAEATDSDARLHVQEPDVLHDDELWYPDGSIVLIAERRAFRVYRGILVQESVVFRDLLSSGLPQPEGTPEIDRCPLLQLEDSAEDLRHFLRFLLCRRHFVPLEDPIPFSAVAAIIRLGHKYQVDIAEKEGLRLLQTIFVTEFHDKPSIVDGHIDCDWAEMIPGPRPQSTSKPTIQYKQRDAITAAKLARLTDVLEILPTAFYLCCQLDIGTLLQGNGTDSLGQSDLITCLIGRDALSCANAEATCRIFEPPPRSKWFHACNRREACRAARDSIFSDDDLIGSLLLRRNILMGWQDIIESNGFCDVCDSHLSERASEEVQRAWDHLPSYFSLDISPWNLEASSETE